MLGFVNPPIFTTYVEEMKLRARHKVKLLKEKSIQISDEAEKLFKPIDEDETNYLYRQLIRKREVGRYYR